MKNTITIPCKDNIVDRVKRTLEKLEDKGFSAVFNGDNFDLIDDKGKCLSDEGGMDLISLEEYTALNYFFSVGEKVQITHERTEIEAPEIYDEISYNIGTIGFIESVSHGEAYGVDDHILFNIRIKDKHVGWYTECYIWGDFKLI